MSTPTSMRASMKPTGLGSSADEARRDHQLVAHTVRSDDQRLHVWKLTAEWFDEDERLESVARAAYAAWKAAYEANPRRR